jgi:hypothetical protein
MKKKFTLLKVMIFLTAVPILLLVIAYYNKKTPEKETSSFIPVYSQKIVTDNNENLEKNLHDENTNSCFNDKAQFFSNFVESLNLPFFEKVKILDNFEKRKSLDFKKLQSNLPSSHYYNLLLDFLKEYYYFPVVITTMITIASV